jgi:hypothetical protein
MRKAAVVWPTEDEFAHRVGAQLPWRHITILIDHLEPREDQDWYAVRAAAEDWKREVLDDWAEKSKSATPSGCNVLRNLAHRRGDWEMLYHAEHDRPGAVSYSQQVFRLLTNLHLFDAHLARCDRSDSRVFRRSICSSQRRES